MPGEIGELGVAVGMCPAPKGLTRDRCDAPSFWSLRLYLPVGA